MPAYDDLPDNWKTVLPPNAAPAAPAASTSAAPPASTTPPAGTPSSWDDWLAPPKSLHDIATATTGGIYSIGSNIVRNLGYTPNQLPSDAQTAMKENPRAALTGQLIGGTAVGLPLAMGATEALPAGYIGSTLGGALTGGVQNLLTGNPDESWYRRLGTGALVGAGLGTVGEKIGRWFGAGRALDSDVADAAQNAQREGVTDIGAPNLPGGNIKAMGAPPTYQQAGQIDNATSKILGDDVPDWSPANFNAVQGRMGSAVSKAANAGSIDVNAPLSAGGPTVNDVLSQIGNAASAHPEVGAQINPLITRIQARIGPNGIISGKDFDNLVGNGSVLHDLVGDGNPYIKEAAQALDSTMDAGFRNTSGVDAYNDWVDARTGYRMLMGVQRAIMPNGHINPTTLFNSVQNRFTDLKGIPVSADPVVGRMGQFADSVRTLFGGGSAPPQESSPGLLRSAATGLGFGSAPAVVNALTSGELLNPANYTTPAAIGGLATAAGTMGLRTLGQAWQRSQPYINALIGGGGAPVPNALVAPTVAGGTQAFPQRQVQP